MNISLPESFRDWLEEQAAQANQSVDEYVQHLIEEAKERRYWEWVETKVGEALNGAAATPMTRDDWDRLKRRITDRVPDASEPGAQ
jgi:hypothetical protein